MNKETKVNKIAQHYKTRKYPTTHLCLFPHKATIKTKLLFTSVWSLNALFLETGLMGRSKSLILPTIDAMD
jgi:hypothetical protein